eukprot:scaffold786_cov37-Cyclotella_meneghiniana.AAC.1
MFDDEADHKSKLYVKSKWTPSDQQTPSWVLTRVTRFFRKLDEIFKRVNATSNLNPLKQELLNSLPSDPTYLFPEADKGLGPCAVKFIQYIEDVLVHLCNEEIYERLTEEKALLHTDVLHAEIIDWLNNYEKLIGKHAYTFIKDNVNANLESPFGQFYVLYKIHKGINDDGKWLTRPVSSDVTSLPHALGNWDSFELKTILDTLEFQPNALPFTADAHSMFTNIKTEPALMSTSEYIRNNTNMGVTKKAAL